MDLFSDLTSCLVTTPMVSCEGYSKLVSLFLSKPTVILTGAPSPMKRPSQLRKEYIVPGAGPEQESSSPTQPASMIPTPALEKGEDGEEYDPDYATYLLTDMITQDELRLRRENEELYRAQVATQSKRYEEDQTRRWLGENLVYGDVRRATKGLERTVRASEDKRRMMKDGWSREGKTDVVTTMGAGTPGLEGHRNLHEFLENKVKKRKIGMANEGENAAMQEEWRPTKKAKQRRCIAGGRGVGADRSGLARGKMRGRRHGDSFPSHAGTTTAIALS